ncbi:MAG: STAS domain-containing protein [Roseovarius sp.]|nr:STAS domain-containing protein [Roseovarius sp.]MCY4208356.1 STAS domain-containing protein [Roseovarius sp.]MCY4293041.1 STAS domain-containing protein [Roseovarius sp.]MCY4317513.1 STAS domain-containing protein [Roseovarius sp.]
MDIRTERENGTMIASVEGRIDGLTARDFEITMKSAISEDDSAVILDLAHVTYVSSAGLRAFLLIAKNLWKREATFLLCDLSEPVQEVFDIAGFDKIIKIIPTRTDAIASLGS